MSWQTEAVDLKRSLSWKQTAKVIRDKYFPDDDLSRVYDRVRSHIRRHKDKTGGADKTTVRVTRHSDSSVTSERMIQIMEGQDKDDRFMLQAHGYDPAKWEIIDIQSTMWQTEGKDDKYFNCHSKIRAKVRSGPSVDDVADVFRNLDRKYRAPVVKCRTVSGDRIAEVNIADLHLKKLAWHGDTGGNYDTKIARKMVTDIVDRIYGALEREGIGEIVFVWSNDFFNSDTIEDTTTAGTAQDVDCRWQKGFNIGVEILVETIDKLRRIAPVQTFYTPSNHDQMTGYHALRFLDAWFRNDDDVTVDIDAFPRKYRLYGKTLVGYCHGHKENSRGTRERASRLASCMPAEVPQLWAQSRTREFHAHHLHSEQMIEEINSVLVRRISSPTANDTYHTENGYIGQVRKAQTFVYDKEDGLVLIINTPVRG